MNTMKMKGEKKFSITYKILSHMRNHIKKQMREKEKLKR